MQINEDDLVKANAAMGVAIRKRRKHLGLTQGEVGKKLGLTLQQIQKYEMGNNRISAARLIQFSEVLDVPISYFYDEAVPPSGWIKVRIEPTQKQFEMGAAAIESVKGEGPTITTMQFAKAWIAAINALGAKEATPAVDEAAV